MRISQIIILFFVLVLLVSSFVYGTRVKNEAEECYYKDGYNKIISNQLIKGMFKKDTDTCCHFHLEDDKIVRDCR